MTTIADTTPREATRSRIWSVVRLHFVNPTTVLVIPAVVLGGIFVVNLVVWWIIETSVGAADRADARDGFQWSGASFYIFVYMIVVAVQAMNATFAFAQGFSVTRRDFYLGSGVAFVLLSALWSAVFTVMGFIESATGGWGLGGRMFTSVYFTEDPLSRALVVFLGFLFCFFVGAAVATVYVRWRAPGLSMFLVALAVVLVGVAALITLVGAWPGVGAWFASAGPVGITLWSLVVTALASLAGYLNLRRATASA